MRAFTVYQPYAMAIVSGIKRYETRPRRTNIRGTVAVHAAMKQFPIKDAAARKKFAAVLKNIPKTALITYGGIIGTVEIAGCVPVEDIMETLTERERLLGEYSPGRFAWILQNPVMFDCPIPARGKQGWWEWQPIAGSKATDAGPTERFFRKV